LLRPGLFALYPGRAFRKRRDPSAASHKKAVYATRRSLAYFPPAPPPVLYHQIKQADRSGE
jgi:hypothetical protein